MFEKTHDNIVFHVSTDQPTNYESDLATHLEFLIKMIVVNTLQNANADITMEWIFLSRAKSLFRKRTHFIIVGNVTIDFAMSLK